MTIVVPGDLLQSRPPEPWQHAGDPNPRIAAFVRRLFRYRDDVLAYYPWVPLSTGRRATPIGALLVLWHRWDQMRGACPRCGDWAVGVRFGAGLSCGGVVGYCTACGLRVKRTFGGGIGSVVQRVKVCLNDTPFTLAFDGFGWWFEDGLHAAFAVLAELGASGAGGGAP